MLDLSNCNSLEAYVARNGVDVFELTEMVELNANEDAVLCIAKVTHVTASHVADNFRIRVFNEDKQIFVSIDNNTPVKAEVDLSDPESVALIFDYDNFEWTLVLTK